MRKIVQNSIVLMVLFVELSMSTEVFGQKEVLYEQYLQNPMAINPAFTGAREDFNMTAILRRRWFSIPNSPVSQTFSSDGTVANGKVGIGFQALNDRMSAYRTVGIYASGAYHFDVSPVWKASLGVQAGINVLPVGDGSGYFVNKALGSAGVGGWIRSESFYTGISMPEVLSKGFGNNGGFGFSYRRPLFVIIGGNYELNETTRFLPTLLLVNEKAKKLRVDVGSRFWFSQKLGLGASYRMGNVKILQLSAEAQVSQNIRLGYTFNSRPIEFLETSVTNSTLTQLTMHELMIKFIPSPTRFHWN